MHVTRFEAKWCARSAGVATANGQNFGACRNADVRDDECMHEQSTSASEKTHACDGGQNQMERTEDMRGVRQMGASDVAVASYIM